MVRRLACQRGAAPGRSPCPQAAGGAGASAAQTSASVAQLAVGAAEIVAIRGAALDEDALREPAGELAHASRIRRHGRHSAATAAGGPASSGASRCA